MTGNTSPSTPGQAFPLPVNGDDPDVPGDLANLAKAIEKRVMGVYATTSARDAALAAMGAEEGIFAYTRDTNTVWYYDGAAWKVFLPLNPAINPAVRSGTAAPSNSTGVDGDVYIKY